MLRKSRAVSGTALLALFFTTGHSLAFEDVNIAPTRFAKNYLQLQAEYDHYERDQVLRATDEKVATAKQESNYFGIQGFMTVNDRLDLRATFYRSQAHYKSDWPGHERDETKTDPSNISARIRYKFFNNETGGLVGRFGAQRRDSDRNDYFVDIAPYVNISPTLVGQVYVGYGSEKTSSDLSRLKRQYITPTLHWKANPSLLVSPYINYTHYDSRDVYSSQHTKALGVEARYDIDEKWSIVPAIEYEYHSKLHNDFYINELGKGKSYTFFLGLRRHFP